MEFKKPQEHKEATFEEVNKKFEELKKIFDAQIKNSDLLKFGLLEFGERDGVRKEFDSVSHFLKLSKLTEAIGCLEKAEKKITALLEKIEGNKSEIPVLPEGEKEVASGIQDC